MNFGRFRIDVDIPAFPLWVFLMILAVLTAFWYYRSTLPPVSTPLRRLLAGLRAVALLILLTLVFDPLIRFTIHHKEKPELAVLVDMSASMGITDGKPRGEILKDLLRDPAWADLERRFTVKRFGFADGLSAWAGDSTRFDGPATDIGAALSMLQKISPPPEAVLLLSDGANDRGPDPRGIASGLSFPVHSVAIGDSAVRPDLAVVSVFSNETVYAGKAFPIEASVAGPGMAGRTVSVRLMRGDSLIDEKPVVIPASGFETTCRFSYTPAKPGFERLTVSVPKAEGETVLENNSRTLAVRVVDSQIRVAVFADAPGPDLAAWSRLASQDPDLRVMVRTARADGGFYEGPMLSESELNGLDLVVFIDVPSRFFPVSGWQAIRKSLISRPRPLWIVAGRRLDWDQVRGIANFIPFGKVRPVNEIQAPVRLTPEGGSHPLFADSKIAPEKLPPILCPPVEASWDPSFEILARFDEPAGGGRSSPKPAILFRSFGGRRSLVFLGSGWFRWALAPSQSIVPFELWIGRAARWLAERGGTGPVRVRTDRSVYRSGERVRVAVEASKPIMETGAVSVEAELRAPWGEEPVPLTGDGSLYTGSFQAGRQGDYRMLAKASSGNRQIGADTTGFAVLPFDMEYLDSRANPKLLSQLAEATGGRSVRPEQFSEFAASIECPPRTVVRTNEWQPSRMLAVWAAAVVFLFLEWAVRRRKMMS